MNLPKSNTKPNTSRFSSTEIPTPELDPAKQTSFNTPAWMRKGVKPPVVAPVKTVKEGVRLVGQTKVGDRSVKIYRDTDWNEFRVEFYVNGKHQVDADYHTDDKQDAMDSSKKWLSSGQASTGSISESVKDRIVGNLVRIEDIVEGQKVYGGLTDDDRRLIKHEIKESMRHGMTLEDAVMSMIEEFKNARLNELASIGAIGPGGKAPAPAATTTPATAANVAAPAGTTTTTATTTTGTTKPVGPQTAAPAGTQPPEKMNPQMSSELGKFLGQVVPKSDLDRIVALARKS